ncbi:metallophosphoesterase [Halalkalicoccus ordinarius]|uniref:metallophosphoesterase n=1 Tax=Halalkalicoccus ordinarius TaxID=3116651 RepID=UPI00300EFFE7
MTAGEPSEDDRIYYFISDLHIGGDEQLEHVDFLEELLGFLRELESTEENAELIINGDAFGLWEFTGVEGIEKFNVLVEGYPELFEQLRATGENVRITLIPGNHDYELAAYDEYVERLAAYNVVLEQAESITRPVGDRSVWIEHGMQRDPNNRVEDFGSPYASPLGYYVNRHVTSRAGKLSDLGRYNWLKDIQAVSPTERIPMWVISKYFYREMHPVLRYAAIPFLLLFEISVLSLFLLGLDMAGIWSTPVTLATDATGRLGLIGWVIDGLLIANLVVVALLVLVAIPLYLFARDVRTTLDRFGIVRSEEPRNPDEPYVEAAREVFESAPETAAFVYGHTHRPAVTEVDDRVVINTGTWLKRLHRRDVVFGLLPPVFYPSFRLNYVRISESADGVVVDYRVIDKPDPVKEELTLTERLLTHHRRVEADVPDRVVVDAGVRITEDAERD